MKNSSDEIIDALEIKVQDEQEQMKQVMFLKQGAYYGMTQYEDKSHSIVHEKVDHPKTGDIMFDYKQRMMQILEIIETRDHRGVFETEAKRKKISIVTARPVVFLLPPKKPLAK
ncbi:hypothetical protein [Epilithonimonas xixisoli]|uniref:Uncharacterized protein n=1 Tax=Epilithonimonas xixisoli TaxID=1476462 RepID=A0A4R8I4Z1_9FLAO|nr:hypothetical protein [Epilithonimonas xixisoli]TDX83943.1 hypothetical protein B0I22_1531 [Epilithonimonas xixisoli]